MPTFDKPDADLSVPFVFVPNGAPDPVEWRARHPGWARVVHFGLRARRGDEGLASTEVVVTARCPRRRMVECLAVVTGIGARMRGWARGGP